MPRSTIACAVYAVAFALLLLTAAHAKAHLVTEAISGTVVDTTGAVIQEAEVTLTNEGTSETRETTSGATGDSVFTALVPGTYRVSVQKEGFQLYEQTGITLTANQRLALGNIELPVGAVTERVTVEAAGEVVRLRSAETTALLSSQQPDLMLVRGRDTISLIKILPAVSQIAAALWGEVPETHFTTGNHSLGGSSGPSRRTSAVSASI